MGSGTKGGRKGELSSTRREERAFKTHLPELVSTSLVSRTHLDDESNTTEKDSVITILNEGFGFGDEVVDEVGDFADDSKSTEGGLRREYSKVSLPLPRSSVHSS